MTEERANAAALDEAIKMIRQQKQIIAIQRMGVMSAVAAVTLTIITNIKAVHNRR